MCKTPPEPAATESFLRNTSETGLLGSTERSLSPVPPNCMEDRLVPSTAGKMAPGEVDAALLSQMAAWPGFAVLAIRIDSPAPDPDRSNEPQATLERLLKAFESGQRAVWSPWQADLYGCVIPDIAGERARELATALQAALSLERPETISIGISAFPLSSFTRTQCLINARKALEHAAFFGPGSAVVFDAVSLNISGDQHYQAGDMEAAMAEYRDALRLDPLNVNVHNSLGVCMARAKDFSAARDCFQTALAINPHESMTLFNLGLLKHLENDLPAALVFFKSAHAVDPRAFEINLQLGALLVEQECWSEALPFLEAAVTLQPGSARAHCCLGQCLAGLNRTAEAIQALSKAAKLNPNDAAALSALGMLYAAKGENPDVCMTFGRQSVLLAPQNALYRFRLGCLYKQFGQVANALAEFESAAALGYDSSAAIEQIRHLTGACPLADQQLAIS